MGCVVNRLGESRRYIRLSNLEMLKPFLILSVSYQLALPFGKPYCTHLLDTYHSPFPADVDVNQPFHQSRKYSCRIQRYVIPYS